MCGDCGQTREHLIALSLKNYLGLVLVDRIELNFVVEVVAISLAKSK